MIDEEIILQLKGRRIKTSQLHPKKLFFLFFFICFLASGYFIYLQFFFKKKALGIEKQIKGDIYFSFPPRGDIYDKKMKLITGSSLSFDIYLDLTKVNELNLNRLDLFSGEKIFYRGNKIIIRNFNKEKALKLLADKKKYPYLEIIPSYVRSYEATSSVGNLIGYLGFPQKDQLYYPEEFVGQSGLEFFYQDYLRGKVGEIIYKKSYSENKIKKIKETNFSPGKDLVLSIDLELQKKIYQKIDEYFKENNYRRGAFVLINPNSGAIISLISYPSYNPEAFLGKNNEVKKILNDTDQPLFNRVVSGLYNPGSTIKPVVLAAALEEKIINPNDRIFAAGEIKIPNPYFPNRFSIFKDNKFHGWTDARKAIADSVNIYFYVIGGGYPYSAKANGYPEEIPIKYGLGIERLNKYWRLFGLGQKTGIDFPNEKSGFLPSPKTKAKNIFDPYWRLGDTYNVSIGQGDILVTPLQIALLTSYFATGKIYQPYLVEKIVSKEGQIIFQRQPKILYENIISPENLKVIQEGMRMTVTQGTAKILGDLPVAGKSGTPEIMGKKKLNAIFTGYFPYKKPEAVMTLLIEDVPIGSVATLPLYRELVKLYLEMYGEK